MGWFPAQDPTESLLQLAHTAWTPRRLPPSPEFLLKPDRLPATSNPGGLALIVENLYSHARKWAPGLEVPFRVPHVAFNTFVEGAGEYRVNSDGWLFITIAPQFQGQRSAILTILAHEACHHILDLSGIRGVDRDETERLTDLAAFICGFGYIILAGYSQVRSSPSDSTFTHLGYLTPQEYQWAQQWVLKAQGLSIPPPEKAARTFWQRIAEYFRPRKPESQPETPIPVFDPVPQLRKVVLARLGGDQSRLDRLLEYERRRQPNDNEAVLLDRIIETLERDRR